MFFQIQSKVCEVHFENRSLMLCYITRVIHRKVKEKDGILKIRYCRELDNNLKIMIHYSL